MKKEQLPIWYNDEILMHIVFGNDNIMDTLDLKYNITSNFKKELVSLVKDLNNEFNYHLAFNNSYKKILNISDILELQIEKLEERFSRYKKELFARNKVWINNENENMIALEDSWMNLLKIYSAIRDSFNRYYISDFVCANETVEKSNIYYNHNLNIIDDLMVISFIENTKFHKYNLVKRGWIDQNLTKKSINAIYRWFNDSSKIIRTSNYKDLFLSSWGGVKDIESFNWIGNLTWTEKSLDKKLETVRNLVENNFEINSFGGQITSFKNKSKSKETIDEISGLMKWNSFDDSFSANLTNIEEFYFNSIYSIKDQLISLSQGSEENQKKFKISISISKPWPLTNIQINIKKEVKRIILLLTKTLSSNVNKEVEITLFNFQGNTMTKLNKLIKSRILKKRLFNGIKINVHNYNGNIKEFITKFSESNFCINYTYESLILSNIFNIESYNFEGDPRIKNHLKDINSIYDSKNDLNSIEKISKDQFSTINK